MKILAIVILATFMVVLKPAPANSQVELIGGGVIASIVVGCALGISERRVCDWHYLGWDCQPEQNPPEGWLRPMGYCDQARLANTLTSPTESDLVLRATP